MTDHTVKEYNFADTSVRYIIMNDTGKVFLQLIPQTAKDGIYTDYKTKSSDGQFVDVYDWFAGALCHIHLSHHKNSPYSNCYKFSQAYDDMYFKSQEKTEDGGKTVIRTVIGSDEGYEVIHKLTNYDGENGFEIECEFVNNTDRTLRLEAITSASLDGLSPYCDDDSSKALVMHTFRSGWATEGKHICRTVPELNLEKSWGGNYANVKIGTQGSRPVHEYFPYAAVEDTERKVLWGLKLVHNGTWQIDLSRCGKDLSLSCGLGDKSYGNWFLDIEPNGRFTAPKALAAAVCGDISDLSDVFLKMCDRDIKAYGEEGMGIVFNEWCTSWGKPSHSDNLRIADKLAKTKVKYFVMDAGWYDGTIGDWEYKKSKFPDGLKKYTDDIRKKGFIPGIWMEFECTGEGSYYTDSKYNNLHLKNNGAVIQGVVSKRRYESFWDMREPEAREILREKVIAFLKDNGFGYLKVDYNANIGIGCDGACSPGEGLRQHLDGVYEFFKEIKREIPDIVIENCSAGGMRLEPKMMGVTAMSSFSDAHECYEFPIIAANLHYLIPPCQSQIWNVLKPEFDTNRFQFTVSAGFLGRMCWSGNIVGLSDSQMEHIYRAEEFYGEVSDIIRHGKSKIYRTDNNINFRAPKGTQAVLRFSEDTRRALLVYHCFYKPERLEIEPGGRWKIKKALYDDNCTAGKSIVIDSKTECMGNVILLEKE